MIAKSKKISKKKIKEDKLVTSYYKVIEFYEEHQTKIIIAAVAVIAVIAAIVLYNNKLADDNVEATTELSRVIPIFEAGSYQEAIDGRPGTNISGLKKIVENYGGTDQGEIAKVYLAHAYFFLNDIGNSLGYYEDYSGDNKLFKATALAGQASCHEAEGQFEKAASKFKEAAYIDKFNPSNPDYLLRSGINYMKIGEEEEAKDLFEKILEDYESSNVVSTVNRYLAALNS